MFEHFITYYPISYFVEERNLLAGGERPLSGTALPIDPDSMSLNQNEIYLDEINKMGEDGWELVNVAPLLRGCYDERKSYGYSLTAGYYFFWKRKRSNIE